MDNKQDIYMHGYIDGMKGFDPDSTEEALYFDANDELFDVYARLRGFSETQCNELTDNQRKIFDGILDDFDHILENDDLIVDRMRKTLRTGMASLCSMTGGREG